MAEYFANMHMAMPKQEVGEYVARQGFAVPLIRTQAAWEEAFDAGRAMIRSEHPQDFSGFSGVHGSEIINPDDVHSLRPYAFEGNRYVEAKLGNTVLSALRSGELSSSDYMRAYHWPHDYERWTRNALQHGYRLPVYESVSPYGQLNGSRWEYLPGALVRMFRDPHVAGRYHMGMAPPGGKFSAQRIDRPWPETMTPYNGQPVELEPLIATYEAISHLLRFDSRECPHLELVKTDDGAVHFLQYLATGHKLAQTEPYTLPDNAHTLRSSYVRGATQPDGEAVKLYINPNYYSRRMHGQAVLLGPWRTEGLFEQYLSRMGAMIVQSGWSSLKEDHFSSAPLLHAPLYVGIADTNQTELLSKFNQLCDRFSDKRGDNVLEEKPEQVAYVRAHITANGHQAAIETDFKPYFEDYA